MTKDDAKVMAALRLRAEAGRRLPTTKELSHESGVTRGHLFRCLDRLVETGHLRRTVQTVRYELVRDGDTDGKSEPVEQVPASAPVADRAGSLLRSMQAG